jgi:hypothetical protein
MPDLRRNPFALGPMTGSPMEIFVNLHSSASTPTTNRHPDARLVEMARRYADLEVRSEAAHAEHDRLHIQNSLGLCDGASLTASMELCDAISTEEFHVMEDALRTPAQTLVGIVAKLRIADLNYHWSTVSEENDNYDYVDWWMGEALRDAERLAGLVHEDQQGGGSHDR